MDEKNLSWLAYGLWRRALLRLTPRCRSGSLRGVRGFEGGVVVFCSLFFVGGDSLQEHDLHVLRMGGCFFCFFLLTAVGFSAIEHHVM